MDRVDFDGPYAQLLDPIDNDPADVDQDRNATVVRLANGLIRSFLRSAWPTGPATRCPPQGTGVQAASVNAGTVIVTQNGVMLTEGRDFRLGYSPTNNTLLLTPLSGVWEPDSVYQITLVNQGAYAIADLAGNRLRANQPSGARRSLRSFSAMCSPTTATRRTATGRRPPTTAPGTWLWPAARCWGRRVDTEANGAPTANADGDDLTGSDDERRRTVPSRLCRAAASSRASSTPTSSPRP